MLLASTGVADSIVLRHERPNFLIPPTTENGFENLESKTLHLCENQGVIVPRNHRRDLGSPRHRFRLWISPVALSSIKIMDFIVPAPPLPHHILHSK